MQRRVDPTARVGCCCYRFLFFLFEAGFAEAEPAVDDFLGDGGALDDEDHTVVLLRVVVVDTAGVDGNQLV